MTSKEALYNLSEYIGRLGGGETQEWEDVILRDLEVLEQYKTIKEELGIDLITLLETVNMLKKVYRDLEVLEILKRHIKQGRTFALYDVETNNVKTLDVLSMEVKENNNDYHIIKDWLNSKEE